MIHTRWHALREMVEQWTDTVSQVERGYSLTFDDYLNDLDLRRLIDESLQTVDDARKGRVPKSITDALATADERFRCATVASDVNVWGAENERDSGWSAEREWYYYRRPEGLAEE